MRNKVKVVGKEPDAKRENSLSRARKTNLSQSKDSPVDQILSLQRTVGNRAVQRLFKSGAIQAKLKIGQPGDIYEREADQVAEQVMQMPDPKVQRQPEEEEEETRGEEEKPLPRQLSLWTVAYVKGEVCIEKPLVFEEGGVSDGPASLTLTPGQEVVTGTEIILGKNSSLTLTRGGVDLRVSGGKEGRLFTLPSELGKRISKNTVTLLLGRVWAGIRGLVGGPEEYEVKTSNAVAGVRG